MKLNPKYTVFFLYTLSKPTKGDNFSFHILVWIQLEDQTM